MGNLVLENNTNIDKEQFLKLQFEKGTVQDYFNSMIAKIGENLILNDLIIKKNKDSRYSFYIHNSYRKNIGKIISLIQYSASENNDEIEIVNPIEKFLKVLMNFFRFIDELVEIDIFKKIV